MFRVASMHLLISSSNGCKENLLLFNYSNFSCCFFQVSLREYLVRFTNSTEEAVDISRIGRKIEGWLRIWEGVRVCALCEPRYFLNGNNFLKFSFIYWYLAVNSSGVKVAICS